MNLYLSTRNMLRMKVATRRMNRGRRPRTMRRKMMGCEYSLIITTAYCPETDDFSYVVEKIEDHEFKKVGLRTRASLKNIG